MDTKGISKLDLKRRNRRQILLAIREAGMLARVDIAAQLSLTRAAVTIITNQMIAQNILEDLNGPVIEQPDAVRRKGRKKTMIRINPSFRYVLGAAINEYHVSVGLTDINNEAVDQRFLEISNDIKPEELISFIVNSCRELMQKHALTAKQILGLGVGIVPAHWEHMRAEQKDGKVSFEKLCYLLEMELSVPVLAESAIRLYALAGIDYTDKRTSDQVLIYSGQKFHAAAVYNNELLGGFSKDTSTVDRILIKNSGTPCEGYPDGSVHAELTRSALLAKIQAATGKAMTMEEVTEAYNNNEPQVSAVYEDTLTMLSRMIYNLCTIYDVRCATMQCFRISGRAVQTLQEKLLALTGAENEIQLRFSTIDGELAFRAGSALAIEKLFFEEGGLLAGEQNA